MRYTVVTPYGVFKVDKLTSSIWSHFKASLVFDDEILRYSRDGRTWLPIGTVSPQLTPD